jgi:hypothetical protein
MTEEQDQLLRLMAATDNMDDHSIWQYSCVAVALAGMRARKIGREDIEKICVRYIETMAKTAGTTPMQYELDS